MKYCLSTYVRLMHETLQELYWTQLLNEKLNYLQAPSKAWEKTEYIKNSDAGWIGGKGRWWVVSYKPMLKEMDCGCGWSCPWCGTDCVWGWCSAGQMVLVGRWVNNDVSPQCSNYLLPGPCCSPHRLCAHIHKDTIAQKWTCPRKSSNENEHIHFCTYHTENIVFSSGWFSCLYCDKESNKSKLFFFFLLDHNNSAYIHWQKNKLHPVLVMYVFN